MSDKTIGNLLAQIKNAERFERRDGSTPTDEAVLPTSFGSPLTRCSPTHYRVDMTDVLLLSGISEWTAQWVDRFRDDFRARDADLLTFHAVSPVATPELAALGIRHAALAARRRVAAALLQAPPFLVKQLRIAICSLQCRSLRDDLFSSDVSERAPARLFPFAATPDTPEGFVLLEYDPEVAFLRLTLELTGENRLHLKRIPHRIVSEKDRALFAQDADALAEIISLGLHQAGRNQRESHTETPDRQPAIFQTLHDNGLRKVNQIRFTWQQRDLSARLQNRDPSLRRILARTLLLLEEESAAKLLDAYREIELAVGKNHVFIDLSRRGACLNIAFERRRRQTDLNGYLARLPILKKAAEAAAGHLRGIRVVFIHHFTAETLAFIQALRRAECAHLHGIFIRYKGPLPDAYLEAIMALPEAQYVFHSLSQIEHDASLTGRYLLSSDLSPPDALEPLAEKLRAAPADYFTAMRWTACHCLMRQLLQAERENQRVLLIEDGGYAAPAFNRWTAENITLHEAIRRCHIPLPAAGLPPDEPFARWLPRRLLADIEHTRNGYDQLIRLRRENGPPAYPAYTIALSDYKNSAEAHGAAMSILMGTEYILAGQGDSLHQRHVLVIGSRGHIGRRLLAQCAARNGHDRVIGCDLTPPDPSTPWTEYPALAGIPPERLAALDLIIGITGHPVLQPSHIQHILLNGQARRIYLVSGSTKNVELAAVSQWLQELRTADPARIGGHAVRIEILPLRDPITEIVQGTIARVHFEDSPLPPGLSPDAPWKDILFAADGMPLNFTFFGVPGEIMDRVMQQLLQICRIAMDHQDAPPPPDIYVLDYNLDEDGDTSPRRPLP